MAQERSRRKQIQPGTGPERAFGDALRQVRKRAGISQERLALDAGFDRTYVSLIERGIQSPTIRTVVRLAGALGVTPSEIVVRMEALLDSSTGPKAKRRRSA